MTVNRFKRQKIVRDAAYDTSRLLGSVYEPPEESLINFPSSIVNGITKEGGLASLTLKSVAAAKVVEESTWIHEVLFKQIEAPTRIIGKPEDLHVKLAEIKADTANLTASKPSKRNTSDLDNISSKLTNATAVVDKSALAIEVHNALKNFHTAPALGDHLYVSIPKESAITFDIKVDSAADVILPAEPTIEEVVAKELLQDDVPPVVAEESAVQPEVAVDQVDDSPIVEQQVDEVEVPQSLNYLGY